MRLVPSRFFLVIFFSTLSLNAGSHADLNGDCYNYSDAEELCINLISMWENQMSNVTYMKSKRFGRLLMPFVTLSFAQSVDGMIACKTNTTSSCEEDHPTSSNLPISCHESLVITHALRSIHDAILIGGNTFSIDKPRLNNRLFRPTAMRQPLCVVLDTHLTHLRKLLQEDEVKGSGESLIRANNLVICCSHSAARIFRTLPKRLSHQHDMSKKIRLLGCKTNIDDGTLNLVDVLVSLKSKFGIKSVLVEGGANVLSSFLDVSCQQMAKQPATQIVDIFVITISPKILGAINGLGSFSKFNSLDKQHTFPSLDFLSPTSFFRRVGSDLVIASPMRGL